MIFSRLEIGNLVKLVNRLIEWNKKCKIINISKMTNLKMYQKIKDKAINMEDTCSKPM